MTSPGVIDVDGLTFNGSPVDGVSWLFDSIDGWHGGPSVSVEQTDRTVSHGIFAQPGHRGGRTIAFAGTVSADTRAPVQAAVERLGAFLADGSQSRFEFTDEDGGLRWADVQLAAAPDLAWDVSGLFCRYQLQVLAADPYRYGATSSATTSFGSAPVGAGLVFPLDSPLDFGASGTTGTVTLTNAGTASASVVFTVVGPTPTGGFEIVDTTTGKRITYLGAVPTGSTLVLDGSDGSVVIDGVADRLGDTIVQAWPTIGPGMSRDFLFTPTGGSTAATLTAACTSTYW